ncbi:MAG TPA: hypothetical protein PKA28_02135 [Methylomusa anaerophila]|uniref:Uncharacterized protein n=1 Tax=Methylomusa anaerophila TaxID=1930071 RepID=A0A348APD6_9FIRM|nr:hypothetical protein [Methylomusa anaerophila]BBB92934.1 hypothetical protein MAMMFC1_03642 [Methylomusa anaerophila]HML87232.1 hypothetical protein [Methylomusa anaerophila]
MSNIENLKEQLTESTRTFSGKVINVRCDKVLLPNGNTGLREVG